MKIRFLIIAFCIAQISTACYVKKRYTEASIEISDRVKFIQLFECKDAECNTIVAYPSRQIVTIDNRRIDVKSDEWEISYVYDLCDRVFVVMIGKGKRSVGYISDDNRIVNFRDLSDLGTAAIVDLECESIDSNVVLDLTFRIVNENSESELKHTTVSVPNS